MNVAQQMAMYRALTESALRQCLKTPSRTAVWPLTDEEAVLGDRRERPCSYAVLYDAAVYSALAGGKRLRPALLMEFFRLCGGEPQDAATVGAALEMVHTYSLIHDDLPCMDNDDLRRGKPTNHKVYGEAMAVLAGDALLNRAFETILSAAFPAQAVVRCASILARAAGMDGMLGGQVLDLTAEQCTLPLQDLVQLQQLKTGALIRAAAQMGCALAGRDDNETMDAAVRYGNAVGLAFQIRDDLLDLEGDSTLVGKTLGKDRTQGKSTFPALLGVEKCQALIGRLTESAKDAAHFFAEPDFLAVLADRLAVRDH